MTLTTSEVSRALALFEFAPGRKASWRTLQHLLPDVQTALFFSKAFKLDYQKLSELVFGLFQTPVLVALSEGDHSTELQDYIIDTVPEDVWPEGVSPSFTPTAPQGDFLPELWESLDVTIAKSIAEVADKLGTVLDALPSKEGQMVFQTLARLNRQRPTIGVHQASIHHGRVPNALVILDVSGSMSEHTIRTIVSDVVALSWKANAHLAIVSNHTYVWEPGTYGVDDVLARAEYSGTHYETLAPLFERQDWGTVITIADYDSSHGAKRALAQATSRIGKVLDISLVNRPTFLAECVGQLADEVQPLLVATSHNVLSN